MELRHLRYFVAVSESLHFGQAAAKLQIAQPSLSHQIRQLEIELQTTLLRRTKRRVELTEAGRTFLEEARDILARADRAAVNARRASRGEIAPLRVGVAHWIDPARILASVRSFNAHNPTIQVDLQTMSVPAQLAALREERLDVGFVRPPIGESSLASEMLVREPFVIALPATHRFAGSKRIPLSSLANESFVFIRRDALPVFYDLVLQVCRQAAFVPHAPHEADHPQMVLGLVAAGMGISLVPASVQNTKPRGLVLRSLRPSPRILESGLAWRREDTSPTVNGFLKVARRALANSRKPVSS
jgi:DNA-binding transcriptional LysR family regulator